ncbi:TIGR02147 family protein [Pseudobacteriovorax antillogorgiicola]|uniref:TIGR02147 family protein n=1 Tax=Pseudobacteriovorax antillogorgiicola TaxID=1513793 RepID=A0A1Y6BZV5_9BACT|nr:TIGR02147 family protein [Pseudobacteriovorax antillogorgiicola]TCS52382.1 uncharacterized protein (TIGR02147 family) [Pseudobacteriovorax antillogorgiicola]SMF29235.1 TIGR02147 family protein [Pseudobacteriovorax antillogorgiicola]
MVSVTKSVLLSHSGIESLEKIIALRKTEKPSFSKNYISKRIGLKSRGYLTDVFKGRKKLSARYVGPIIETLSLDTTEATLLEKKILLETEFAKSEKVRDQLDREIKILTKTLKYHEINMDDMRDIFTFSLVYLSLFLFPEHQASERELMAILKDVPAQRIQSALRCLHQRELVTKADGIYKINHKKDFSFLFTNFSQQHEIKHLQSAIDESRSKVPDIAKKRDEVLFLSSLLTVKKQSYMEAIDKLKDTFRTVHSELEDDEPDTLVRLNLQMYPVISKEKERCLHEA